MVVVALHITIHLCYHPGEMQFATHLFFYTACIHISRIVHITDMYSLSRQKSPNEGADFVIGRKGYRKKR